MKKKIIILSIVAILVGIIVVAIKGFNVNLKYKAHKVATISLNQEVNMKEIKAITDEVLGNKKVILEKSGVYGDEITINAEEITEEQLEDIVNKINEKYNISQKMTIALNDSYELADVEAVAKEALGSDTVTVEKSADDEKSVEIKYGIITEKKAENLANKLNEKYTDLSLTSGSVKAIKCAILRSYGRVALRDIAKQYLNYVIISVVIILVYFAIRFRKLGVSKILAETVISLVLGELLYTAILAIVRYPIDKLVILASVAMYLIIVTYLNCKYIKLLSEEKKENK